MSRVGELLAELVSAGVPYLEISNPAVSRSIVVGATPSSGVPEYWSDGTIPWMSSGEVNKGTIFDTDKRITQAAYDSTSTKLVPAGAVVIALAGQGRTRGTVARTRIELCTNQSLAAIVVADSMDSDYLYHFLKTQYGRLRDVSSGDGTRGGLNLQMIRSFKVPVPPLEVQQEIARILDKFAESEADLEADLEAELESRRRQYEHYRDALLSFTDETLHQTLGELGELFGGLSGKTKADFSGGNARFASYKNVFANIALDTNAQDFVRVTADERQKSLAYGDVIFTGSSESLEDVGLTSAVNRELTEPMYLNSFSIGFRPNNLEQLNPDFAKHLFRSAAIRRQVIKSASGVTRINLSKGRLLGIRVPVPTPQEQLRLAKLLDRFYALVNDLNAALSAELAARRKQYQYYSETLLTFREVE